MYDTRLTYIYLFKEREARFIFNRSVDWGGILSKRKRDALESLGYNQYSKILLDLDKNLDGIVTKGLNAENDNIKILEIHVEWENRQHCDQKDINVRKRELADKYDAQIYYKDLGDKDADTLLKKLVLEEINNIFERTIKTIAPFVNEYNTEKLKELKTEYKQTVKENKTLTKENDMLQKEVKYLKEQRWKCYCVLTCKLEPQVYEFYSEKLRTSMREREMQTVKYLLEKNNNTTL